MLASSLEILVFVLIGFIVPIDVSNEFFINSLILFFLMVLLRFLAISLAYLNDHTTLKEKVFMSFNCSKGIAVAVVAFTLSKETISKYVLKDGVQVLTKINLIEIPGTKEILQLMVLFMIYSIILSSVSLRFSEFFIKKKVE